MQQVLIAHRNDEGRHAADRIRGALDASLHVRCTNLDELDDDQIEAAVRASDRVLVIVDRDWADEGGRALDDEPGRRLRSAVTAALAQGRALLAVTLHDAGLPVGDALGDEIALLSAAPVFPLSADDWADDVAGLIDEVSAAPPVPAGPLRDQSSRQILFAAALVGIVVVLGGLLVASRIWFVDAPPVVGQWVAEVDYGRGVVREERFEFRQTAGEIAGSASWQGARRVIEDAVLDGERLSFHIRTHETLGSQRHELRHDYVAVPSGPDALRFSLRTTGGFSERDELSFKATRTQ
ncbi:MAG: hypothetical protein H2060_04825 [Azoarcus sp.]|nr:hypothetical protein [Azoarcus sp.]